MDGLVDSYGREVLHLSDKEISQFQAVECSTVIYPLKQVIVTGISELLDFLYVLCWRLGYVGFQASHCMFVNCHCASVMLSVNFGRGRLSNLALWVCYWGCF